MTFLLDTSILSEWVKPSPDIRVAAWLAGTDEDTVFLSVMILGEIRHGMERLPPGARRSRLDAWAVTDLPLRFEGRMLEIDEATADRLGAADGCGARPWSSVGRGRRPDRCHRMPP